MSVFTELRRRNVYRIAAAYVVAAWLVIQLVETIFPAFGFDEAATRLAVIVLMIGFVPAVVLAWVFEITPQGLRLDTQDDSRIRPDPRASRRLDQVIIAFLVIAVAYFAFDKIIFTEANEAAPEEAIAQVIPPWAETVCERVGKTLLITAVL